MLVVSEQDGKVKLCLKGSEDRPLLLSRFTPTLKRKLGYEKETEEETCLIQDFLDLLWRSNMKYEFHTEEFVYSCAGASSADWSLVFGGLGKGQVLQISAFANVEEYGMGCEKLRFKVEEGEVLGVFPGANYVEGAAAFWLTQ